jgi:hypothetical protein
MTLRTFDLLILAICATAISIGQWIVIGAATLYLLAVAFCARAHLAEIRNQNAPQEGRERSLPRGHIGSAPQD